VEGCVNFPLCHTVNNKEALVRDSKDKLRELREKHSTMTAEEIRDVINRVISDIEDLELQCREDRELDYDR